MNTIIIFGVNSPFKQLCLHYNTLLLTWLGQSCLTEHEREKLHSYLMTSESRGLNDSPVNAVCLYSAHVAHL